MKRTIAFVFGALATSAAVLMAQAPAAPATPYDYMLAAASLGASPAEAFRQVFVPLTVPGLAAGIIIVFVLCLGFYVTPALLGGGRVMMWSMQIERNVTYYADWGAASALGVVLLVVTVGIMWVVGRVVGFDKIVGAR